MNLLNFEKFNFNEIKFQINQTILKSIFVFYNLNKDEMEYLLLETILSTFSSLYFCLKMLSVYKEVLDKKYYRVFCFF